MQNKLAVSNIAWSGDHEKTLAQIAAWGVQGIEVAPGKITGGWDSLDIKAMHNYRTLCEDHGLSIPSFQAFLFGKPHLQLLGEPEVFAAMLEHVNFVAELAAVAGARVLVYGAPKSRQLLGHNLSDAESLAIERLGQLAAVCVRHDVSLGLEAVPAAYGGEFITSYADSLRIVQAVNSPGLVLHLDAGCTWLNGDNIATAIDIAGPWIRHFHISQPQLSDFSEPAIYHTTAAKKLRELEYGHWLCIEMRETDHPMTAIEQAVRFIQSVYDLR